MYHQLPSTVLREATTFDIMVTDVYAAWEKYQADPSDNSHYREDQLTEILKSTKEQ
jgi:hypothetical protein